MVFLTCFVPAKAHVWGTILGHVGGENKKKAELSTIEYSASALSSLMAEVWEYIL